MMRPSTTSMLLPEPEIILPRSIEESLHFVARRQMIVPALLFLVGHRPLAFVCGQCLMLGLPLGFLISDWPLQAWAEVLSHPHGPECLEQRLRDLLDQPSPAKRRSADESVSQS